MIWWLPSLGTQSPLKPALLSRWFSFSPFPFRWNMDSFPGGYISIEWTMDHLKIVFVYLNWGTFQLAMLVYRVFIWLYLGSTPRWWLASWVGGRCKIYLDLLILNRPPRSIAALHLGGVYWNCPWTCHQCGRSLLGSIPPGESPIVDQIPWKWSKTPLLNGSLFENRFLCMCFFYFVVLPYDPFWYDRMFSGKHSKSLKRCSLVWTTNLIYSTLTIKQESGIFY